MTLVGAYAAGLAGILVLLVVTWLVVATIPQNGARHKWLALIEGKDGRLSTSKFQWSAWTFAVVGGFCAVFAARALRGDLSAEIGVSAHILTALGFSTVTMATAKGVTMIYTAGGRTDKTAPTAGGLLTDDDGIADLSKIQLITWTVIAIGIWVYLVIAKVSEISSAKSFDQASAALPDIPLTLMILMGLSQGGYLGKKIVSPDRYTFGIDALVPSTAEPKDTVAIFGHGFDDTKANTSAVLVGGLEAQTSYWSDVKIQFQVPADSPDRNHWKQSETVDVTVVVDGYRSDKTVPLTVTGPPSGTSVPTA